MPPPSSSEEVGGQSVGDEGGWVGANYQSGLNNGRSWKNGEAPNNEICSCNSQACWHLSLLLIPLIVKHQKAKKQHMDNTSHIIIIITIIMLTPSYLLPAVPSRGKQKTGICRRTTSPRWEQTIVWEDLSMEEVNNAVLWLSSWWGWWWLMMDNILKVEQTMLRGIAWVYGHDDANDYNQQWWWWL